MKKKINLPTKEQLRTILTVLLIAFIIIDCASLAWLIVADCDYTMVEKFDMFQWVGIMLVILAIACVLGPDLICQISGKGDIWAYVRSDIEVIDADHGDTLEEVMDSIRNEAYEYLAIFSMQGDKLDETTSLSTAAVAKRLSTNKQYGTIQIHNHPSRIHCCFSVTDLYSMIFNRLYQSYVVSGHYAYVITNERLDDMQLPETEEIWEFLISTWHQPIYRFACKIARPLARWYSVCYSRKIARHFGLKFQRGYFIHGKVYLLPAGFNSVGSGHIFSNSH